MRIAKVLLLGDIGVGKTSIARRLVLDRFESNYKATIGTDIYRHEVTPSPTGQPFHFVVWDTDGNFGESIFVHVYAKQADAAVIIGDVTRPATLATARQLGDGFMDNFPGRPLIFIANKVDLLPGGDTDPCLPGLTSAGGQPTIITSARTGHHVRQAFDELAAIIARRF